MKFVPIKPPEFKFVPVKDEKEGALMSPDVSEAMGDELKRRGKAALGGYDAAISMLSQIPSFVGGAFAGVMDPRHGGSLDEMANQIRKYQDAIPYYKPRTEEGQTVFEMLEHGRELSGSMGGDSPALRTLNEAAYDFGSMIIPIAPGLRARRPTHDVGKIIAEAEANRNKPQPPSPEPDVKYEGGIDYNPPPTGGLGIERQRSLLDRQGDVAYEGIINPDYATGNRRFSDLTEFADPNAPQMGRPEVSGTRGATEPFPYNFKAHENAVDFPLRQEVLDSPQVKEITDIWRAEYERLKNEGASPKEIAQFEQGFAEYMQQFGVKNAADAHGLNRRFWEHEARQLPIEKTNRPHLGEKTPWEQHTPSPFEMYSDGLSIVLKRAHNTRRGKLQEGAINFEVLKDGFNRMKIVAENIRLTAFTNKNLDAMPDNVAKYVKQETVTGAQTAVPVFRIVATDIKTGRGLGLIEFKRKGEYLESDWTYTEPKFRGKGIARAMYRFARELGNDIRASSALSAEGRKMWPKLVAGEGVPPRLVDHRLVLPAIKPPLKMVETAFRNARTGEIVHSGPVHNIGRVGDWPFKEIQSGFVDNQGRFYTREEAARAMDKADISENRSKEWKGRLMSEDFNTAHGLDETAGADTIIKHDIFSGPGKKQEGAIRFGGDPEFKQFKDRLPEPLKKNAKAIWKEYKKQLGDIKIKEKEGVREALNEIPNLDNVLNEYTDAFKSLDELKEAFLATPDIPGNVVANTVTYGVLSGAKFVGRIWNSPMVKWGGAKVRHAQREAGRQIAEVLYNTDTGLVPMWQKLSKQDKIDWARLTLENEGIRTLSREEALSLGYPKQTVDFYTSMREALDQMHAYGDNLRLLQGYKPLPKREGYFPAKFIGDFYVTIHKVDPETQRSEIVGLYASNSLREVRGFHKELKQKYGNEYVVSEIIEKDRGRDIQGLSRAYGVYSDLMRVVESGSPDAAALSRIIGEYQKQHVKKTAGFFLHEKYKKGIEGSTGRNEFRDQLRNADDMMSALQGYTHQLFEYGEFAKIGQEFKQLLDRDVFPNKENTQKYLQWYFDQARGVESEFSRLANDVIDYVAHTFGVGGGILREGGAAARSYLTWNLLSGHNLRFLLQQLIQPGQFLAQNLQALRNKGLEVTHAEVIEAVSKGFPETIKYQSGFSKGEMRADIEWAAKNNVFDQSLMHDLKNLITDKGVNLVTLMNGNYWIRKSEQYGRMQVFVVMNELLKNKLPREQRLAAAADITTEMMTDYRPFEMPAIYRKLGPIGTAASALARFKHNFMSQGLGFLADYVHSKDPKHLAPFVIMLSVNSILAGALGLPGREDIDFMLDTFGKGFGLASQNLTQFILASNYPVWASHGLVSSITGSDLSASLSAGAVLPKEHTLFPLVSKALKIADSIWEAATHRTKAKVLEAAKEVLPTSGLFQTPVEKLASEGDMVIGKDNQGKFRRTDESAWMKRWLSLRDIGESKEQAAMFELEKDEVRRKKKVDKLIDRAYEDARAGVNIIEKYREEMVELQILPQDLLQGIQRIHKDRMTTQAERFSGVPPTSPGQIRRYEERRKYVK